MTPILVLGIGNILLRDEGVGVHVVKEIQKRAVPEGVEVYDGGTFGIDLIDTIAGRRKVIVIDAVQSDAAPATVLKFGPEDMAAKETRDMSLHQLGLLETLTMTQQLGCAPDEVVIFGIVPKEMTPGLELSAEVAAIVPKVVELVMAELAETPSGD
jgi:hydrogenase maturation protease